MVRRKWWMAALSSTVIILSFFLLMNVRNIPPEKIRAAVPFVISPNAVAITDYPEGKIVTATKVKLESSGYVVVHEDRAGAPGMILGYSKLLKAGESDDVAIGLSKAAKAGDSLYVMLHLDDGDGKFNAKADMPAKDNFGNSVVMMFVVGSDAEGSLQVSY